MKLLTFYTESHKELFKSFFLNSFNEYLKDDFILLESNYKQVCEKASYGTPGFGETMIGKLEHIIKNIDVNDNQPMVFSDCDVQFFKNIKTDILEDLGEFDIKFQDDILCLCAGFFVCRQNEVVLNFFKDVLHTLLLTIQNGMDDQQIINTFLTTKNHSISFDKLPREKYFTVASSTNAKQWNGEKFIVPNNIILHHANWTVGLDNKFKLMEYVKNNR
jgi:hypothetical protein